MNSLVSRVMIVAGSVILIGVAAIGYFIHGQLHPSLPRDLTELGDIRLTKDSGTPVLLKQTVKLKAATIVAFWATWCVPCRSEATELAALRKRYGPRELGIVYLNVDDVPNAAATASFLRAAHAEDLQVLYAGHVGWKAFTGTATAILPRSYIFDRRGRAAAVLTGFGLDTKAAMAGSLAKAIAG